MTNEQLFRLPVPYIFLLVNNMMHLHGQLWKVYFQFPFNCKRNFIVGRRRTHYFLNLVFYYLQFTPLFTLTGTWCAFDISCSRKFVRAAWSIDDDTWSNSPPHRQGHHRGFLLLWYMFVSIVTRRTPPSRQWHTIDCSKRTYRQIKTMVLEWRVPGLSGQ